MTTTFWTSLTNFASTGATALFQAANVLSTPFKDFVKKEEPVEDLAKRLLKKYSFVELVEDRYALKPHILAVLDKKDLKQKYKDWLASEAITSPKPYVKLGLNAADLRDLGLFEFIDFIDLIKERDSVELETLNDSDREILKQKYKAWLASEEVTSRRWLLSHNTPQETLGLSQTDLMMLGLVEEGEDDFFVGPNLKERAQFAKQIQSMSVKEISERFSPIALKATGVIRDNEFTLLEEMILLQDEPSPTKTHCAELFAQFKKSIAENPAQGGVYSLDLLQT